MADSQSCFIPPPEIGLIIKIVEAEISDGMRMDL
jgi:hypothetical protein